VGETKYCLCCGEDVPVNHVERHERREVTCAYCGFTLDVQKLWEPTEVGKAHVLVADDSKYVREIIVDALKSSKFHASIVAVETGLELTAAFSRLTTENTPVDIAIIDLNMPVMDGVTAARTIRSIESQRKMRATPIIFFSAVKADEALRAQMDMLAPASYVNKGSDPDPDSLAKRVEQLVGYLVDKYRKTL
jgi:CheY-like chemotaxis protein